MNKKFQVYIFPRMTKCTFHKFGTSGEIEKHDAMCILPLNIGKLSSYICILSLNIGVIDSLVVYLTAPLLR